MPNTIILFKETKQIPIHFTDAHFEIIREACGGEVSFFETEEDLLESEKDAEILITWGQYKPITFCSNSTQLKWIFALSAGVEGLVISSIGELPIAITNAQGIHGIPMTDSILCFILNFLRGLPLFLENQKKHLWDNPLSLQETFGKTVMIIGAGKIGTEVAKRCKAFNMRTIGVGARDIERPYCDISRSLSNIDDLLPEADFIVLLLPINPDTHHIINAGVFSKMKTSAVLINCGRGAVVDEQALVRALQDGVIGGAGLDATEVEPLPEDSPLWDMPNVIITPHCSATSPAYLDRAIEVFVKSAVEYRKGNALPNRMGGKL